MKTLFSILINLLLGGNLLQLELTFSEVEIGKILASHLLPRQVTHKHASASSTIGRQEERNRSFLPKISQERKRRTNQRRRSESKEKVYTRQKRPCTGRESHEGAT